MMKPVILSNGDVIIGRTRDGLESSVLTKLSKGSYRLDLIYDRIHDSDEPITDDLELFECLFFSYGNFDESEYSLSVTGKMIRYFEAHIKLNQI